MGQRGELFSNRLFIDEGQKTFFFNVKENRFRDRYINIVESRKSERGFKRSSLVVFDDDVEKFLGPLNMPWASSGAGSPWLTRRSLWAAAAGNMSFDCRPEANRRCSSPKKGMMPPGYAGNP